MVVFLCNNDHKFGRPIRIEELARLGKVKEGSELDMLYHLHNSKKSLVYLDADWRTYLYDLI